MRGGTIARPRAAVTLRRDAGSRIPLATTAMGKAYLCGLPQNDRDFLMGSSEATFDAIQSLPAFYGARKGAGHTATVDAQAVARATVNR